MREILFKAKCANWKESCLESRWISGGYAEFNKNSYIVVLNECVNPNTGSWDMQEYYEIYPAIYSRVVEIDPRTLSQYTGFTDKNGRKIFEGDIVRRFDLHNAKEPSIGFIEYDAENTSFLIHWTDIRNYSATFPWKDRIEVIGNIFDNPELVGKNAKT